MSVLVHTPMLSNWRALYGSYDYSGGYPECELMVLNYISERSRRVNPASIIKKGSHLGPFLFVTGWVNEHAGSYADVEKLACFV